MSKIVKFRKTAIGFDLDDVILNSSTEIFKGLGLLDRIKDCYCHNIEKVFPETDKEFVKEVVYDVVSRDSIPLVDSKIKQYLSELKKYYDIFVVTARSYEKHNTIGQLESHDLLDLIDEVIINGDKDKSIPIIKHKMKVFVDDRAYTLDMIAQKTNSTPIVFDKPWNERLKYLYFRVFSWKGLFNLLTDYKHMI